MVERQEQMIKLSQAAVYFTQAGIQEARDNGYVVSGFLPRACSGCLGPLADVHVLAMGHKRDRDTSSGCAYGAAKVFHPFHVVR